MSSKAISTVSAWPSIAGMRAAWTVITFGPLGVYQRICCARDRFAARGAHRRHVLDPQRPVVEVADVEHPQVVLRRLGARRRTARHPVGRGVGEEDARRARLDEDQRHRHLVQHGLQPPLLVGALRRQPFRVGLRRLRALARQRLFGLVLEHHRHVLDGARRAEQRQHRDRDRPPAALPSRAPAAARAGRTRTSASARSLPRTRAWPAPAAPAARRSRRAGRCTRAAARTRTDRGKPCWSAGSGRRPGRPAARTARRRRSPAAAGPDR